MSRTVARLSTRMRDALAQGGPTTMGTIRALMARGLASGWYRNESRKLMVRYTPLGSDFRSTERKFQRLMSIISKQEDSSGDP